MRYKRARGKSVGRNLRTVLNSGQTVHPASKVWSPELSGSYLQLLADNITRISRNVFAQQYPKMSPIWRRDAVRQREIVLN